MAGMVHLGPAALANGELRGYEVGDTQIVLVARLGDRYFALDDWCNHAGCLLSGGRLLKELVVCPCHEVGFELATGRLATSPAICDDQRAFAIEEREGQLYLHLEQPLEG